MIELNTTGQSKTVANRIASQTGTAKTQRALVGAPTTAFAKTLASVSHKGRELDSVFEEASETYGVPQELLRAISFHESGFQPDAVSSAGAMGLMQLMPVTAQTMGVQDPFDPQQNVMGGAKLLSQYMERYDGDLKLVLAAYGAGCGSVAKYGGVPPFPETQRFVENLMSVMQTQQLQSQETEATETATLLQSPAVSTHASPQVAQEEPFRDYPEIEQQVREFSGFTLSDYDKFLKILLGDSYKDGMIWRGQEELLQAQQQRQAAELNGRIRYF